MSKARLILFAGASLSAMAGFSSPAAAADAAPARSTAVQEVIVTAERRATDIQKTPVAITAVKPAALDKSFITEVSGLNSIVPSLQATKTSGFENIVTIRGIGSETPENDLTTVPGVSLFMDGVYVINTISLEQTLFDIDHIEVLRGPQGALYGQSSIGGAINIVSNQPQLGVFSGQGDFSAGTYSLFRERAEINVPIGQTLAVRLSAQRFDRDGFTDDLAIPGFREDNARNTATKAAIKWQPISNFQATLTGQWYRATEHGQAQKNINDPLPDPWQIFQDYPSKNDLTTQLYHLNLQYDTNWFSVRSVTGYQHMNSILQENSSRSAFSLLGAYDDVAAWNTWVKSWTEEVDILSKPGGPVDWILGGFLLDSTSNQFVAEFECQPSAFAPPCTAPTPADLFVAPDIQTNPPGNLAYGNNSRVKRQSYSVFGQATWHILPNLRLTGGARLNIDYYRDDSHNFSAFGFSHADNHSWDHVPTWRVEMDYDVTGDNMVYASAARGYKPGGVNGAGNRAVIQPIFRPETNTAFEIGSKNYFLDRTLRLNAGAFYYLYDNMQYIEDDPVPFAAGITNIPSVHIYGLEAEASYTSPNSRLHINANLALEKGSVQGRTLSLDSTVVNAIESTNPFCTEFGGGGSFFDPRCWNAVIASARNIGGNSPPAMPTFSGSFNVAYDFDFLGGTLTPRVEVVHRGAIWARIFNEPSLDRVPGYTVTNLNLEFVPRGSRLRLDLTATNVGRVAGINSQYTDPFGTGQTSRQFISPRQVIFTVGYSF